MSMLTVTNLCKEYPGFSLKDVSFSLEDGKITGFIGRNGAGKSTTLKCLLDLVHPLSGEISFFGRPLKGNEISVKEKTGCFLGGSDFYPNKRIKTIVNIASGFFSDWDQTAFDSYMREFSLDQNKTPAQLSEGMRVKFQLALALSHGSKLLILDEPTSGLDPVSRDEILDIFLTLCDRGVTIFFSTHITSDLDRCADNIIYIRNGQIVADTTLQGFVSSYKEVELDTDSTDSKFIGIKREKHGFSALVKSTEAESLGLKASQPDLEQIMLHLEKESQK